MSADDLLKRALEIPEAERAEFLDHACGGDAALRDHVERLLAASVQGDGVEGPSVQSVATRAATWNPAPPRSTGEAPTRRASIRTAKRSPSWTTPISPRCSTAA